MGVGKQCHIEGCDSMAEYEAHVKLWYKGQDGRPVPLEMKASAIVCAAHRVKCATIITSDQNKAMLSDQLIANGLGKPDFDSIQLEFKLLPRERTVLDLDYKPPERFMQCGRQDAEQERCKNPAQWQVVLGIKSIGMRKTSPVAAHVLTNLCVCNKHKKLLKPEDFSGDLSIRSIVTGQLAGTGFPMPDWKLLELEYQLVKGGNLADTAAFMREKVK